ncbi:MAG: hypothetical protein ABJH82_13255 [Polaribacter sp.]|uniref:hypothetical protein n=1 Tax=Polaribacter sp. TaxID=1920175 RepID=UPI003266BDBB
MKKATLFLTFIIIAFTIKAQDVAMNTTKTYNNLNYEEEPLLNESNMVVAPLLNETNYTYRYKGDDVLVVYKNDEHIEYFNNKKYFIRSKIKWTAKDKCYMTIQESNLPNFPFAKGTKLHMKIIKIKRGKVFYESTLGGRSWTGKMKVK